MFFIKFFSWYGRNVSPREENVADHIAASNPSGFTLATGPLGHSDAWCSSDHRTCFDAGPMFSSVRDQQAVEEPEILLGVLWDVSWSGCLCGPRPGLSLVLPPLVNKKRLLTTTAAGTGHTGAQRKRTLCGRRTEKWALYSTKVKKMMTWGFWCRWSPLWKKARKHGSWERHLKSWY